MKKMLWIMIVAVALMSGCGNKEADEAAKKAEAAKAQADKATAEATKATEAAKAQGVSRVAFDRGGFTFGSRLRALADSAREAGLEF